MKLAEFIADLEKKKAVMQDGVDVEFLNSFTLGTTSLKSFEKRLFECEEFKNVARINFIEMPHYLIDEETEEPISLNREFLGGKTKTVQVGAFMVNPEKELKFNKIVDLYSIRLNKRFDTSIDVSKPGVWVYPTVYDQVTFEATNQIRVIWDPKQLAEALQMVGHSETPKQRLMRMFETALDSVEPNLPCEYVLTIRCSPRSIANIDELERIDLQPAVPVSDSHEGVTVSDGGDAGPM